MEKQRFFPKYEIQLNAALVIDGWTKALRSEFERELPTTEDESLVETESSNKLKIEVRSINARVVTLLCWVRNM